MARKRREREARIGFSQWPNLRDRAFLLQEARRTGRVGSQPQAFSEVIQASKALKR